MAITTSDATWYQDPKASGGGVGLVDGLSMTDQAAPGNSETSRYIREKNDEDGCAHDERGEGGLDVGGDRLESLEQVVETAEQLLLQSKAAIRRIGQARQVKDKA